MRIFVVFFLLLAISCSYKKDTTPLNCNVEPNVSFSTKVNPILINSCLSCHNNSFTSGGISLQGYNNVRNVAINGKLIGVISHASGFGKMPQGASKLDNCTISAIKSWVDSGALNN